MATVFSLASVSELVDALTAADIRADREAARLTLPGVWVQPQRLEPDSFGTTRTIGRLVLIVPDLDPTRALEQLDVLLNQVAAVYPVASATLRTVLMPDGAALPGLEVPFTVRVNKQGETE